MTLSRIRLCALASAAILAALLLPFAALQATKLGLTYPCPFKFFSGLPCPTCGSTRALSALAALDLPEALRFNPLLILGPLVAAALYPLRERFPWIRQRALALFLAAIFSNWIYLMLLLPR